MINCVIDRYYNEERQNYVQSFCYIFSMYELSEQPTQEKTEDKTDLNNQRGNGVHMLGLTSSQYIIMQNKHLSNNLQK